MFVARGRRETVTVLCVALAFAGCRASVVKTSERRSRRSAKAALLSNAEVRMKVKRAVGGNAYSAFFEDSLADPGGYRWHVRFAFALGAPRKSVAQDRPGTASINQRIAVWSEVSNETPGRRSLISEAGRVNVEICGLFGAASASAFTDRRQKEQPFTIDSGEALRFVSVRDTSDRNGNPQVRCPEDVADSFIRNWPSSVSGYWASFRFGGPPYLKLAETDYRLKFDERGTLLECTTFVKSRPGPCSLGN